MRGRCEGVCRSEKRLGRQPFPKPDDGFSRHPGRRSNTTRRQGRGCRPESRRPTRTNARKNHPVLNVTVTSPSKGLTKAALTLVQEHLVSLGFRRRKLGISSMLASEDVLGLVGLNTATSGRGPGILEINTVIGVRNQRVERLVAELVGEPFREVSGFTVKSHVGYLSPQREYQPVFFVAGADLEEPADQLVEAVRLYGLPFIYSNVPLPALLKTMQPGRFCGRSEAAFRVPVTLHLLGQYAEADAYLSREIARVGDAADPWSERFKSFARRFQEWNHPPAS